MESPSFVVSLNSLVNSFFTFPIKLPPEMKSNRDYKLRAADPNNPVGSGNLKSEIPPTHPIRLGTTISVTRFANASTPGYGPGP